MKKFFGDNEEEKDLVPGNVGGFKKFIESEWRESVELVKDAYKEQERRNAKTI